MVLRRPKWRQCSKRRLRSTEPDLLENALAGEQLGGQADHKAHHGQTAIPGLGKFDKSEAGVGSAMGVGIR